MNFLKKSVSESCNSSQANDVSTKENIHFDKKVDESSYRGSIISQPDVSDGRSTAVGTERTKLGINIQGEYRNTLDQQLFSAPISIGREISYLDQSNLLNSELLDSYSTERSTAQSGRSVKNTDLIKMIQALKSQLQAKNLKMPELRKKAETARNKGVKLTAKLNEAKEYYYSVANTLEQLENRVGYQESEIEFLNDCNRKSKENIQNNKRANIELKDFATKIMMYEKLVEEKKKEASELKEKLRKAEMKPKDLIEIDPEFEEEANRLNQEIRAQDKAIKKLIKKIEKIQAETEGYKEEENRLGELADLQDHLMEENDKLKEQINIEEEKLEEVKLEVEESDTVIKTRLSSMYFKLQELNEHVEKLAVVVEAIVGDKEDQIGFGSIEIKDFLEDSLPVQEFKSTQLSKKVACVTEDLHKKFTGCLEQVWENNRLQYQNDCSQQ